MKLAISIILTLILTLGLIASIVISGCVPQESQHEEEKEVKMADVLLIIAQNFRDEELFDTKDVLEQAGLTTVIASKTSGVKKGMFGKTAEAEIALSEVNVANYKAIVFIGGQGSSVYFDDATALKIAKQAISKNKITAAICIAPVILANAGVLKDKNATVWDDGNRTFSSKIEAKGAKYTGKDVERDGNIITANGPEAAKDFGKAIVKAIKG